MSISIIRQAIASTHKLCSRSFATAEAAVASQAPKVALRTSDNDPTNHTQNHVGLFYNLSNGVKQKLFPLSSLPKQFELNCKTFAETNILIRSPAIEIMSYLKQANYDHPVIRYVLFGKPGCGKSMTVAHVVHYALANNFMIIYVPSVWRWFSVAREVVSLDSESTSFDLPLEASRWLKQFDTTNNNLIQKLDLRTSKDYVWNKRETTPAQSSLNDLVSQGINRVKYASGCVEGLINELKQYSNNGSIRTLLAIDGFNGFFNDWTVLKTPEKVRVVPDKVTLTNIFLSAVKSDWKNGAVVLTVDKNATSLKCPKESIFPFQLLGKRGVESIDPFIPINVPDLTKPEFNNLMDYLEEKRWLQKPEGREELEFVSQRNPEALINLCAPL